jgi:hypothetical protein
VTWVLAVSEGVQNQILDSPQIEWGSFILKNLLNHANKFYDQNSVRGIA